ncbi:TetR/AcrR family transcriptional regulator [Streptosporangiaceae bacterium NEAU-GS5]|nr:TetR/AcrR family transcriptional regulator [Streptosporangiaceae bacterium NEAU-GS5]
MALRADAARNVEAILEAAAACLGRNPDASMTEIAKRAGLGRVTLYGHFPSREALLHELMRDSLARISRLLATADLDSGPADAALLGLLRSSWQVLDHHVGTLSAVRRQLPDSDVLAHHEQILGAIDRLIARGRRDGVFRADLPVEWLVTVVYRLIQAAAEQVEEGVFTEEQAVGALTATVAAALRA